MTLTENEPRDQAKTVHIGTGIPIDNVTVTDATLANVMLCYGCHVMDGNL